MVMNSLHLLLIHHVLVASVGGGLSVSAQGTSSGTGLVRPAIFEGGFIGFPYSNATSADSDEWSGLDVDIVRYLCNLTTPAGAPTWVSAGIEPYLACTPLDEALITTTIDDRLSAVVNGDADFSIGAISWTPEREKLVDFIRPFYFATGTELLGLGDTVMEWEDLKGKTLCAYPNHHATQALQNVYGIKGYVDVSGKAEAIDRMENGECIALLVDGHGGSQDGPLRIVSRVAADIGASPYGIVVNKNASQELVDSLTAAAVSMLWAGRISPMWSIANNTFQSEGGMESRVNVPATLGFATSAITGFLTRNGNALDWTKAPAVNGSRSVPAPGNPVNATIVVYKGNALPLASIEGDISFLEKNSSWKGMEIEMLQVICSSGIIQCTEVLVANTVDERLSLINDGKADISIGSIVVNQERLSEVYFVQPFYFSAGPALYLPSNEADSVPENATLEYMDGQDVCTVTASAQNPAGEKYGANLIPFETRAEAEAAILRGECIGLLWVSHVQFDGLVEVATDTTMDDPIGIAVRPDFPVEAYSYLSALTSQLMSKGMDSPLLTWEGEYGGSATPNIILQAVTDAVTNFEPTVLASSAILEDVAPEETASSSEPSMESSASVLPYMISALLSLYISSFL